MADLGHRFNYHKPSPAKADQHQRVRDLLLEAAEYLNDYLPEGREKALVITKLEEAMFWANAAIARGA